jgi:hypothetical protein
MAGYRQIHTQIWKDEWFIELEPQEKMLFIYMFSNDLSSIAGIYKIPLRVMANETGLSLEFITETITKFERDNKVLYRDGVLWIVNMEKYHRNASPRTAIKVNSDIDKIPDGIVKKAYLYHKRTGIYSIDTVSILSSESVNVNVNVSVNGIGIESESVSETAPQLFEDNEAEKIFCAVTSYTATPATERENIYSAIRSIVSRKGHDGTVEYIRPFWKECKKRYPATVKAFWLTDWAVAGVIPPPSRPNGNGRSRNEPPDYQELPDL